MDAQDSHRLFLNRDKRYPGRTSGRPIYRPLKTPSKSRCSLGNNLEAVHDVPLRYKLSSWRADHGRGDAPDTSPQPAFNRRPPSEPTTTTNLHAPRCGGLACALRLHSLFAYVPGMCPVLTAWAGRWLSRDLHTPLVRLCSGAARVSAALPR